MKSKSATKNSNYGHNENSSKRSSTSNGNHHQSQNQCPNDQQQDRKPKTINKNNPWNIDPFAPHFTKPTAGIFNQSDEPNHNNKSEGYYNGNNSNNNSNSNSRSSTPPSRYSPPQGIYLFVQL